MGTMIGVGMFGLPVAQAGGGFIPSILLLVLCWVYTACSARLLLEACTWMPRGANFMTISRHLIGKKAATLCWFLYAIFFYCGMIAHIAAAGDALGELTNHSLSDGLSSFLYTLLFSAVVYWSLKASDRFNRILIAGLVLSFSLFIVTALPHIHLEFLTKQSWSHIWPAFPVFLFAFSFQFIIPPLYNYLEGDAKATKRAIWIGTALTFCLYILWSTLVLGTVPVESLMRALQTGDSAIHSLKESLQNDLISGIAHEFAILAISTSFLGVSISFFDFWADSLHWKKTGRHGVMLILLVFLLPLLFAIYYPNIFLLALELGGEVGSTLLLGFFPVFFVWLGRYGKYRHLTKPCLPGGKIGLFLIAFASLVILAIHFFGPEQIGRL